ncbi:MAG: hypothetical protein AAF533_24640 [Acidobacteriota bacterium]
MTWSSRFVLTWACLASLGVSTAAAFPRPLTGDVRVPVEGPFDDDPIIPGQITLDTGRVVDHPKITQPDVLHFQDCGDPHPLRLGCSACQCIWRATCPDFPHDPSLPDPVVDCLNTWCVEDGLVLGNQLPVGGTVHLDFQVRYLGIPSQVVGVYLGVHEIDGTFVTGTWLPAQASGFSEQRLCWPTLALPHGDYHVQVTIVDLGPNLTLYPVPPAGRFQGGETENYLLRVHVPASGHGSALLYVIDAAPFDMAAALTRNELAGGWSCPLPPCPIESLPPEHGDGSRVTHSNDDEGRRWSSRRNDAQ